MLCAQNTDSSHVMLCLQNTDKQNTDNFHRLVVSTENRQFSPSCWVCRTQTNRTQTIITVMCVQNTKRTQTVLTLMLCVQNTDKQNTDNSHCHFERVEHSWAVVWTRPSAVPTTPCGNCSSRTERGTSTVCDTAAYWLVGTDPSRLLWHQDGQTLTQWGTAHHTPTADRSKRAKLLTSPSPFIALRCSLCLSFFFVLSVLSSSFLSSLLSLSCLLLCSLCLVFFFVLSVLSSSFLSSLFSPSCLLLCSLCLAFFLPVFCVYSLCCLLPFCLLCSLCLVFFLPVSLFSLSCLFPSCFLCSLCRAFLLTVFFVLAILPFSFLCLFSLSCRLLSFSFRRALYSREIS